MRKIRLFIEANNLSEGTQIKVIDNNNKIVDTPKRSSLIAIQTPQIFTFNKYVEAMKDFKLGKMNQKMCVQIKEDYF